jgi:hypothetical protein
MQPLTKPYVSYGNSFIYNMSANSPTATFKRCKGAPHHGILATGYGGGGEGWQANTETRGDYTGDN